MPSVYSAPRSGRTTTNSPPPSSGSSSQAHTINPGQPLKVVTRLALEGKAKQGEDGARLLMYLKISIPVDGAMPGTTVPLFPEENIKITGSQIHPLDVNSAPYNFSSAAYPALHNAARALNLPARSSQTYTSLFPTNSFSAYTSPSPSRTTSSNGVHMPPLDEKYTGHILVSGYNVSYVLPKEFPPRSVTLDEENDLIRGVQSPFGSMHKRRGSVGEKNVYQFMAAIEIWVPLLTKPPRAPHLLSIPVPRCLLNNIKLRIVPIANTRASQASLSSDGEFGPWDLTSDPHITRTQSRHSRSSSYVHQLADDESSDSSISEFGETYRLQGSFPSTDRVRVRWATPLPPPGSADGRHRAGVADVQSELASAVVGTGTMNGREGVIVRLEYSAVCRGVWHTGVATLLGLDVGLDTGGCELLWPDNTEPRWTITGGVGFTGWDAGAPKVAITTQEHTDIPNETDIYPHSRVSSIGSTSSASLLRHPLPGQNSFVESAAPTPTGSMFSSVSSLERDHASDRGILNGNFESRPPAAPLTLHVNMNELLPTSKDRSTFHFQIAGTVFVIPPENEEDDGSDITPSPFTLPRFRVLATDSSITRTTIRNEAQDAVLEVFMAKGDLRDAQTRKTVLQRGARTRCGPDGARIALRPLSASSQIPETPRARGSGLDRASSRLRSSSNVRRTDETTDRLGRYSRPIRAGPLIIPSVLAEVALLASKHGTHPHVHSVRLTLPAPDLDDDEEWLEFGLARAHGVGAHQRADFVCASVEGIPVCMETSAMPPKSRDDSSGQWLCWVKIKIGSHAGYPVSIDYVVYDQPTGDNHSKGAKLPTQWHLLLPSFSLPVGRLDVNIEQPHGFQILDVQSDLALQQATLSGHRMVHHSLDQLSSPRVSLSTLPVAGIPNPRAWRVGLGFLFHLLPHLFTICLLLTTLTLYNDHQHLRRALMSISAESSDLPLASAEVRIETVTVTSTQLVHTPQATPWAENISPRPLPPDQPITTSVANTGALSPSAPISRDPPAAVFTDAQASPTAPAPEATPSNPRALNSAHQVSLSWPFKLEWDLPDSGDVTHHVSHGLNRLWHVFRRMYHYPLDPP